jgi:branched-subunit amino acid transport protein
VSVELVGLAVLMFAVTYPARAIPLLVSRFERLPPRALEYLRLVGPAVLGAIAAAQVLVGVGVAWRRNLALGLLVAVVVIALLRAAGIA